MLNSSMDKKDLILYDKIYDELMVEVEVKFLEDKLHNSNEDKVNSIITKRDVKIAFLTGIVNTLRMLTDYEVPEIELPFKQLEKIFDKENLKWLKQSML